MTILDEIVAQKRLELAALPALPPHPGALRQVRESLPDRRDFLGALRQPCRPSMGLIAEVKRASPSAGVICPDFDPVRIARQYEAAGADCLSVLTDERFFQGSLDYLGAIRQAVRLPILRKDFLLDERQVMESVQNGADAVLLIAAILPDSRLEDMLETVTGAGLTALVEVHDETELDRALAAGARFIGVNNRDLRTFTVDLATTERLAAKVRATSAAAEVFLVAESGIRQREDVSRLGRCGAGAILVGESLMRSGAIATKIGELMGSS